VLGSVFISYRRDDSAGFAGRIYDRLTKSLRHAQFFLDVDNILAGVDFGDVLSDHVGRCDALIAVIGRSWLSSADAENRRRLDDPLDTVRIEIEAALGRGIRVIPVLVDGAEMPRLEELPESLKTLARRQKIDVFHANFDADVKKLTRALTLLDNELRQKAEMVAREERKRKRQAAKADRERQGPELTSKVISSEHGPAVRKISRTASDSVRERPLSEVRVAPRDTQRGGARGATKVRATKPVREKSPGRTRKAEVEVARGVGSRRATADAVKSSYKTPKRRTRKAEVEAARLEQARRRKQTARRPSTRNPGAKETKHKA